MLFCLFSPEGPSAKETERLKNLRAFCLFLLLGSLWYECTYGCGGSIFLQP